MSADNWGICPRCKMEWKAKQDAAFQKAADAYGKLPAAEYEALQEQALAPLPEETTMREDYEIWIDEDGFFSLEYSASCKKCGFRHEFKCTEQLEMLNQSATTGKAN